MVRKENMAKIFSVYAATLINVMGSKIKKGRTFFFFFFSLPNNYCFRYNCEVGINALVGGILVDSTNFVVMGLNTGSICLCRLEEEDGFQPLNIFPASGFNTVNCLLIHNFRYDVKIIAAYNRHISYWKLDSNFNLKEDHYRETPKEHSMPITDMLIL